MKRTPKSADALLEHKLALTKIDGAVALASTKAGDALQCARGCASCCVDGLSVLPVEAALIEAGGLGPPARSAASASPAPKMCAFLDDDGACSIYPVRPVLCRTHGLALRAPSRNDGARALAPSRTLHILGDAGNVGDDVSACELNYTARAPKRDEVLDAEALMMLLVTVDRRYRARTGMSDDTSRVSLRELALRLRVR